MNDEKNSKAARCVARPPLFGSCVDQQQPFLLPAAEVVSSRGPAMI
jgi:hypothetical protein